MKGYVRMSDAEKASTRISIGAFPGDEPGVSIIEYLILLVLVAAIAVGTWKTFGSSPSEEEETQPGDQSTAT
jgi:Flp pilus assembly pilin Flp